MYILRLTYCAWPSKLFLFLFVFDAFICTIYTLHKSVWVYVAGKCWCFYMRLRCTVLSPGEWTNHACQPQFHALARLLVLLFTSWFLFFLLSTPSSISKILDYCNSLFLLLSTSPAYSLNTLQEGKSARPFNISRRQSLKPANKTYFFKKRLKISTWTLAGMLLDNIWNFCSLNCFVLMCDF